MKETSLWVCAGRGFPPPLFSIRGLRADAFQANPGYREPRRMAVRAKKAAVKRTIVAPVAVSR